MPTITVGSFNLGHDGFTRNPRGGGHFDRWHAAHEVLSGFPLDVLFRQEMSHSAADGSRLLHEAERTLGMRGFLAPSAPSESPNFTGLFVREDTFRVTGVWPQEKDWWLPPCVVSVRYAETGVPLQLASVHLSYRSPQRRQIEADNITTWHRPNLAVLVGGDFNSYSGSGVEQQPFPDWPNLLDRTHQEHRTRGGRLTDTEPDRILTAVGIDDIALHAATRLGQADALAATSSMDPATRKRQGPAQRIDFQRASRVLLPALRDFRVVPLPDLSDHPLTISVWDADAFIAGLEKHCTFDYRRPSRACTALEE
ncbi:endonuclease/exonuclease/phosphatase family protein [Kitasatospora sp. NPDC058170]|uniref:endonuclease/exonuclease/phosphatase family protein n=1 Tax=Kitasatospora sp. NPDC058170 TaxID=3346364 RepID=UPI0036DB8475